MEKHTHTHTPTCHGTWPAESTTPVATYLPPFVAAGAACPAKSHATGLLSRAVACYYYGLVERKRNQSHSECQFLPRLLSVRHLLHGSAITATEHGRQPCCQHVPPGQSPLAMPFSSDLGQESRELAGHFGGWESVFLQTG